MAAERMGRVLILGGAAAAVAMFALVVVVGGAAWRAWLGAAVLATSIPTGALVLAMMVRLIPGSWREGLAEPLAMALGLLPLAALAMAPVLLAPGLIYGWTQHPGAGAFRVVYLTPVFFLVRGVAWFALLVGLALRLRPGRKAAAASVIGLLLVVPASLLIAFDWLLSLDDFASSGFGLYLLGVQINLALALAVATAVQRGVSEGARDVLGGVLFTSLAIWAYLGFMPYFITWSGDLPPGAAWYLRRGGTWGLLAWAAIALKMVPTTALMFGHVRRNRRALIAAALCTALGAVPEVAWLALPASGPRAGPVDLAIYAVAAAALGLCGFGLFGLAQARRTAPS